ncbi:MAG: hypothetical protein GF387_00395, partial [Candidatus Portnoybacteria bacterium]|nr:hypothetical protein [Candidatus Portnoybacteria bacterium]
TVEIDNTASISGTLDVYSTATSSFSGDLTIAGDLNVGSDDFYVDDSSGYVGIGTTEPLRKFNVFAGYYDGISGVQSMSIANSNRELILAADANGGVIQAVDNSGVARNLYLNSEGGNVGIGDAIPGYKLSVDGTASISDDFYVGEDTLYVDSSNGYVGINSNHPNALLEIAGSNLNPAIRLEDSDAEDAEFHLNNNVLDITKGNDTTRLGINLDSGNIGVGINDPEALFEIQDNDSETELFAITSSSLGDYFVVKNDGYVGIGATTPTAYLDVTGSNSSGKSLRLRSGDTSGGSAADIDSSQIILSYNGGTSYSHAIKTRHSSGSDAGNSIDFYVWDHGTDDSEDIGTNHVMSLNGGNVGIGDTSPGYKLSVDGTASISDDFYVQGDTALFQPHTDSSVYFQIATSSRSGYDALFTVNTTDQRTQLGTNDTTRGQLLIYGDAGYDSGRILLYQSAEEDGYFDFWSIEPRYEGRLSFGSPGNLDMLVIDHEGDVGIGDTTPGHKLSVDGTASISDDFTVTGDDVLFQPHTDQTDAFVIASSGWSSGGDYDPLFSIDTTNETIKIQTDSNMGTDPPTVANAALSIKQSDTVGLFLDANQIDSLSTMYMNVGSDKDIIMTYGGGDVGIGGDISPDYDLEVGNDTTGTAGKPGGGSWSDSSDIRLKTNIATKSNTLEELMKLRPVTYEWINPEQHIPGKHTGLIAQEVEQVFPKWVHEYSADREDALLIPEGEKAKALFFPNDFNAYIIGAVKEIGTTIDLLEAPKDKSSITIDSIGNVGVGTEETYHKFSVEGSASISGDLYIDGLASASNAYVYVDKDGKLHAGNEYPDLAEFMPLASSSETTFEPGDVITAREPTQQEIDREITTEPFIGIKATASYDQNVLGIISYPDVPALGDKLGDNYLPVALAGRVPVKVSSENGKIEVGDYLTTSTKPGVAMKATEPGSVIGKALESYDNPDQSKTDTILVFIDMSWYGGEIRLNENGTIDENVSFETSSNPEFLASLTNGLKELGVSIANGVINATKVVVEEIKTNIIKITTKKDKDNVVGTAIIPARQIEYRVENSLVDENSKIFVSFKADIGAKSWHISEVAPGHGFTVRLSSVTPEPIEFDYWILLVEEEAEEETQETTTQQTQPTESYCGDGVLNIDLGEECDDGNTQAGDGCNPGCIIELEDTTNDTTTDTTTTETSDTTEETTQEATESTAESQTNEDTSSSGSDTTDTTTDTSETTTETSDTTEETTQETTESTAEPQTTETTNTNEDTSAGETEMTEETTTTETSSTTSETTDTSTTTEETNTSESTTETINE